MAVSARLRGALVDGFVHGWLVAGPYHIPVGEDTPAPLSELPFDARQPPRYLESLAIQGEEQSWQYRRCGSDHFVGFSGDAPRRALVRSYAFTQIVTPAPTTVTASVAANGPIAVYLNGGCILHTTNQDAPLNRHPCTLSLAAGSNHLVVGMEGEAFGAYARRFALRLEDAPADAQVMLPIPARIARRIQIFERLFEQAYLERDFFCGDDEIKLHWPADLPRAEPFALRLQQEGRIYAEVLGKPRPGEPTQVMHAAQLLPGAYQLVLMPRPPEFAAGQVRIRRTFDIYTTDEQPRIDQVPYIHRLAEGARHALRGRRGLLPEVAAMALGAWGYFNRERFDASVEAIRHGDAGAERELVGLALALHRYGAQPAFPAEARAAADECLRAARFDSPAQGEENELLSFAARLLVGQRFPAHRFAAGHSGSELQQVAETELVERLIMCGEYGFACCLDEERSDDLVIALASVVGSAQSEILRELAAVTLDKLAFTLALNTHGGIGIGGLRSPSATISRLLWGAGVYSDRLWPALALADSGYELPDPIVRLARAPLPAGEWNYQLHRAADRVWSFRRAAYRTPEYLLTSVPEIRPGATTTHTAWRAVLSPQATVFTNHPTHLGATTEDSPGFWTGDGNAPRIAHWRDALIAVYALPADDWMGFTHAHFPLDLFDERVLREDWAFARCGDAYLALTASTPFALQTSGPAAYRELRAPGLHAVWVCQMGRASEDGDFAAFQARVLAHLPTFRPGGVEWRTMRGAHLSASWQGAPTLDGSLLYSSDDPHISSPYAEVGFPSTLLSIRTEEQLLELNFARSD